MRKDSLACLLLIAAVAAVFGRALTHDFVNYDDDRYILRNQEVQNGFSQPAKAVAWAFTTRICSNWHPMAWLSHLADCHFHGIKPRGHHLTNVLLHAANAVLLFLLLRSMTGEFWPAAFCSALFALHPLRVESVAWVAERKDLLCGFFFLLTLMAYARYARHPFSWRRYFVVLLLFALALMSKPMAVTLPFVLLLLDYWPLCRWTRAGDSAESGPSTIDSTNPRMVCNHLPIARTSALPISLFLEKLPLFLLSAASCVMTFWAQSGAIDNSPKISLPWRLGNAAVSYVEYLGLFFWPADLSVLYLHPGESLSIWKIAVAVAALVGVSVWAIRVRREKPYLLVGWFWFLGTLVPVIGLVQVGFQGMADRYTYIPHVGVCFAVSWLFFGVKRAPRAGFTSVLSAEPSGRNAKTAANTAIVTAVTIVAIAAVFAWRQTAVWQDSETLWRQAIHCMEKNYWAHYNLGMALADGGRTGEAVAEYERATAAKPDFAEARYSRALLLARQGRLQEAIAEYRAVAQLVEDASDPHFRLAEALALQGDFAGANRHAAKANILFARALTQKGEPERAIRHYREAMRIAPDSADAHYDCGELLLRLGRYAEAAAEFRNVLELNPRRDDARQNLEGALRRLRGTP